MTGSDVAGLCALVVREGHPDFLALPWHLPLAEWTREAAPLVEVQRGLSRHEVRFAGLGGAIYAFKELPVPVAGREYEALLALEQLGLPAVAAVGRAHVVTPQGEAGILVTRWLEASLPYRTLFMQPGLERYRERLMDAMASLLVRLHLAGVFWGDCSLSNTLFRRDAGELQACLVDAETTEVHDALSDGQRRHDLMVMEENCAGELADLAALAEVEPTFDLWATGGRIRERYERLWDEITREETLAAGESYRIHERIRALNELGFTVGEIELVATGERNQLRMRAVVTDRDYHRHTLHSLTGIVAADRQAALMLDEIRELRATLARERDRSVPLSVAANQWLTERFEPATRWLKGTVQDPTDLPELYCQVLEHKWYLSEQAGHDVGMEPAIADYARMFGASRPGPAPVAPPG